MTQPEFLTLAGFIVTIAAAVGVMWWRIYMLVDKAKDAAGKQADAAGAKADLALAQIAEYKTHVAETYVSKQGLREMRDEVNAGLDKIGRSVTGIHERIDRLLEHRPATRRRNPE